MNKEEKIRAIITEILYTGVRYVKVGNWSLLAANSALNEVLITDLDCIYQLAKCIEENAGLDFGDDEFNPIIKKFREIVTEYRERPIDFDKL